MEGEYAKVPSLLYRGTVEGLRRYGLPQLRRAGMRGWTLKRDLGRIQDALAKSWQGDVFWQDDDRLMDRTDGQEDRELPQPPDPRI